MKACKDSRSALRQTLQRIFAGGLSDEELALLANLCPLTVRRLRDGTTRFPYYQTIERLSFAAGFILLCQRRARQTG